MTRDETLLGALADLANFGSAARADAATEMDPGGLDARARFIERATRGDASGRRWALGLAPAVAAVALTVVFFAARRHRAPVDFAVEGALQSSGGFIQAQADQDAIVRFTDGSTVDLTPGASGRVNALRERGARFSVERGEVVVHVAKREGGADYDLDAGPYAVHVTGTKFELSWSPANEAMVLQLDEGSVVVSGPHAEAGVGLRAGQTLTASARDGVHITDTLHVSESVDGAVGATPAAGSPATPPTQPDAPTTSMAVADLSATPSAPPTDGTAADGDKARAEAPKRVSWSERVAKGDFASVLAEADNRGMGATMSSASLEELMALADAARYGGRGATSAQALRSVRQRFAGSKAASTAAFLLGRMAEDGGNASGALQLYDATISEGGAFSGEALGRKMLLVRGSSPGEAKKIAEQYLQLFPKGPYADAARQIEAH